MRHNGEGVGHCHNLFPVSENSDEPEAASDDELEIEIDGDHDGGIDGADSEGEQQEGSEESDEETDGYHSSNSELEVDDDEGVDLDSLF